MPKKEPKNHNKARIKGLGLVAKYLKAKEFINERTWSIVGDKFVTIFNGEYLSKKEMEERLPILTMSNLYINKENPNIRKNYTV